MSRTGDAEAIALRAPTPADGAAVWELVKGTGVLDVNSLYAYVLHFDHHAATSVVAERGGRIVGFITAYVAPTRPEVLFVWQVGVDAAVRGQGLAGRMLRELLGRPSAAGVGFLETTVTPSNAPSRGLFRGLARRLGATCAVTPHYSAEVLGGAHEPEELFRIGPLFLTSHPAADASAEPRAAAGASTSIRAPGA